MMATASYGAVPTQKTSIPSATEIPWSMWLKNDPTVRVRVEAQHWAQACKKARPLLGSDAVDGEPAVEA